MELSKEVIAILDYLCSKFGMAIDWTDSNVLPYIKQLCEKYIQWEIHTSIMWICLGIVFLIIGIASMVIENNNGGLFSSELCIVWIISLIASVIIIMCQSNDIITCKYFPEKAIYDYCKELRQDK